jgi:hypothetical protein
MGAAAPTTEQWKALLGKRVAFGHQSVGGNILSGMRMLAQESSVDLPVSETRDLSAAGTIVHFRIGQNGNPASKFQDFSTIIENGKGSAPDIAMMKLCYLDFNNETEAAKVADQYIATIDRLASAHPRTRFIAFTAPLTIRQTGPRAWAKRLMGREPAGYGENVRRSQFNERLRARYASEGRLFDLAQIEAEGTVPYEHMGQPFQALSPAITNDGGHLNARGERLVASRLVAFLAASTLAP